MWITNLEKYITGIFPLFSGEGSFNLFCSLYEAIHRVKIKFRPWYFSDLEANCMIGFGTLLFNANRKLRTCS